MEIPDTSREAVFQIDGKPKTGSIIEAEGRLWMVLVATRLPENLLRLESVLELDPTLLRKTPNGSSSFYSYQGIVDRSKRVLIPPEQASIYPVSEA